MSKNIEPSLTTVGDYLKLKNGVSFIIPEYQRAYSWDIERCDKLWQDINDYANSNTMNKDLDNYFFGTIIIDCNDNDQKFNLIDGQQRTITFLLLLKALLTRINLVIKNVKNDPDSEPLYKGLRKRREDIMGILYKVSVEEVLDTPDADKDLEIYNKFDLIKNKSINEIHKNDLISILQSTDLIDAEKKVNKIQYKQKDNKYTNYFKNFKNFYQKMETSDFTPSDLNNIAKTITDKCEIIRIKSWNTEQAINMFNSLNSDNMPLDDSDIISAQMYAIATRMGKAEEYKQKWEELVNITKKLKEKDIGDINSILMQNMYYQRTISKETRSDTGSVIVTTPGLRNYYTNLNKKLLEEPIKLCDDMINIAKIWEIISDYSSVKILLKFNTNAKLFLASYLYRFNYENVNEQMIKNVLNCMIRLFTVLELEDVGFSSKLFKTFLFGEEVHFVDNTYSEYEIEKDFNNQIRNNWDRKELKEKLLDYRNNVLVYLNEYLVAQEKNIELTQLEKCDIEHIMPISGKNIEAIWKDACLNRETFKDYVNKLGNKILLESEINRSIGNAWFRSKISNDIKDKKGYKNSIYPLANILVEKYKKEDNPTWDKNDIDYMTEKVSERILSFVFGN